MNIKTILLFIPVFVLLSCKMDEVFKDTNTVQPVRYLALGDSYTKGESVAYTESYPAILFDSLKKSGINTSSVKVIAQTGWTTGDLKNAIAVSGLQDTFNLVSLLIGVNNQYQGRSPEEYKIQFTELAERAIQFAGGKKERVFVISIPDYGYTPFGQSNQAAISAQIDEFNAANKRISDSMGLRYYNITPISRRGLSEADLVAGDGLHPSGKMYKEWVGMFVNDMIRLTAGY